MSVSTPMLVTRAQAVLADHPVLGPHRIHHGVDVHLRRVHGGHRAEAELHAA
jgi:hypothetical protein